MVKQESPEKSIATISLNSCLEGITHQEF